MNTLSWDYGTPSIEPRRKRTGRKYGVPVKPAVKEVLAVMKRSLVHEPEVLVLPYHTVRNTVATYRQGGFLKGYCAGGKMFRVFKLTSTRQILVRVK